MANSGVTVYGCDPDEAQLFQQLTSRYGIAARILAAPVSEDTVELAQGNHCISVSHKTKITAPILQALSQIGVEYISTRSAGYNHIDVEFARSVGIVVGNVAYSPDSVADYTIMLMLMAIRNAKPTLLRADMHDYRLNDSRGRELRDMTVGIIGTGRIGTAVRARLAGFGCQVIAYDHRPGASGGYVSLDKLLKQSDIVTLHTPLHEDTHHLLHRQRIQQMKPGAFVINTGRGPLIETEALVEALESGKLGGAALDVLEAEEGIFYTDHRSKPIKNEWLRRLQKLPNAIVTPHSAYYTDHALSDMVEASIVNCLEFKKENYYE